MKNRILALLILVPTLFAMPACDTLTGIATEMLSEPSLAEIGKGLKEALIQGATKGSSFLSKEDGYYKTAYKILLPQEAQNVTNKLQGIPGFSNLEENLIRRINRGAEDAAKEAKPIFVAAIRSMTIQDATNILMGEKNAATNYLHRVTYQALYNKFNPKIVKSLDKVGANNLWSKAATTYNKIPLIRNKVATDLDDYITTEALKGLFARVELEEQNIRSNASFRTSDLLKKVFAKQDK